MKLELYDARGNLQQMIRVEKVENRVEGGYDYTVHNAKTGATGYVEVRFRDLEWFEDRNLAVAKAIEPVLEYEGELIVEIDRFFPHQAPTWKMVPRNMRGRGIGTSVLRTVLLDLGDEGLTNMYCRNPETRFCPILLGEGFGEFLLRDRDDHFFKKLDIRRYRKRLSMAV